MRKSKIDINVFKEMFYKNPHSYDEIAKHFNMSISGIVNFRQRNNLPARGWAYGHPKGSLGKSPPNKGIFGKKSSLWKGGRHIDRQGYVRIYNHNFTKNSDRYLLEHRVKMEKHLKRKLRKDEHVHHKNHNKSDNRITNLEVLSPREHILKHPEVLFQKGHKLHSRNT